MNARKILFYLPEGFADWEGAFLMAELSEAKKDFVTVSETRKMVRSIGRLQVQPDAALKDFPVEQIEMLVLIGSDGWQDPWPKSCGRRSSEKVVKARDLCGGNLRSEHGFGSRR